MIMLLLDSRLSVRNVYSSMIKRKNLIVLFGIAIGARALTMLIQMTYGIHSISQIPGAVAWSDFFTLNGSQMEALSKGLVPYRDFAYSYTPLFLYALYPFYLFGGMEGAVIPILVADAATAPLVYLLSKSMASNRIAFAAGIAYALSPFVLYEEGYLFLSSQPMVFFLLLSIYLLHTKRPLESSMALAISILFKQEAVFILPAYLLWYITRNKSKLWEGFAILTGVILAVSLPFILLAGTQYLVELSYGTLAPLLPSKFYQSQALVMNSTSHTSLLIAPQTCLSILSHLPTTGSYVVCGITYVWSAPTFLDRVSGFIGLIPWVASITSIPFFLIAAPALYLSRRRKNILLLSCSYSMIGFLILFSLTVHGVFSYYFLPVYALLFASATTKSSTIIALLISGIAILVPDGTIVPVLLATLGILCILATQDSVKCVDSNKRTMPIITTSNKIETRIKQWLHVMSLFTATRRRVLCN
jgi:4-amino-4-deoxy-L-arabinose transferase-like glycosyltransferase